MSKAIAAISAVALAPELESEWNPKRDDGRQGDQVNGLIGDRARGEHRRTGDRQAAETIDDSALQVLRETDGGSPAGNDHGRREQSRKQVLHVGRAGDGDRSSEQVTEAEQQQDRLA
jgi:hypothetical protein